MQLVRRQITFHRQPPRRPGPELQSVRDVVSENVWRAIHDASAWLRQHGIKHALVGGLPVGAHGWPRATSNLIVDDSAWLTSDHNIVVLRAGLPVQAHGVPIDTLRVGDEERHLLDAIDAANVTEGAPVAPVSADHTLRLLVKHKASELAASIEEANGLPPGTLGRTSRCADAA